MDWRHLDGALERFSEFFVAPLLKPSSASKEMQAIESEHHKNLQEDGWRMQQLIRTIGQPGTPVSRFSTGNLATLNKTGIAVALERFHSAHYVASNMRAAVLGRESLAELHALAESTFGKIPATTNEVAARRAQAQAEMDSDSHAKKARHHAAAKHDEDGAGLGGTSMPGGRTVGRRRSAAMSLLQSGALAKPQAAAPSSGDAGKGTGAAAGPEQTGAAIPANPDDKPEGPGAQADDEKAKGAEPKQGAGAVTAEAARAATAEADAANAKIQANAAKGLPAAGASVVVSDAWTTGQLSADVVFPKGRLGRIVRWRPVQDGHSVTMLWPLPSQLGRYRSDPTGHLGSLLGDESEGSVLFRIKQELGIAESLSAGLETDASGFSLFQVSVTLSPDAGASAQLVEDAMSKVVGTVYAYLALLRGPSENRDPKSNAAMSTKWRWDERRDVSSASFLFPSRGKAADVVSDAARSMHTVQTPDLLGAPSRWTWDAVAVNETLHQLTPARCIVMVGSRAFGDDALTAAEPIYGTKHSSTPMTPAQIDGWRAPELVPSLALPQRNPFVPKDLSVLPLGPGVYPFGAMEPYTPVPSAISDEELDQAKDDAPPRFRSAQAPAASPARPGLERAERERKAGFPQGGAPLPAAGMAVWWRQDETFRKPVINAMLEVETPAVVTDPRAAIMTSLYLSAVDDHLQAESYRAQMAGYVYAVTKSDLVPGLSIVAGGFTEAMPLWLTSVLGGVRSPKLSAKRFESHRAMLLQSLDNSERTSKPYSRALYYYKMYTGENHFNIPELRAAAKKAVFADLKAHVQQVWKAVRVIMLLHGNLNATAASSLARIVSRAAAGSQPMAEDEVLSARRPVRWLRGNHMIQRRVANAAEGDSAVAVFHQVGLRDDCFAGLTAPAGAGGEAAAGKAQAPAGGKPAADAAPGTAEAGNATALLQSAAAGHRRHLRQEPSRAGRASKARGKDGEDKAQAVLASGGDGSEAEAAAEVIRRRECTVRDLAAQVMGHSMYQPAFEKLRTQQQLGYLVFAGLSSAATMGAAEPDAARSARLVHGAAPARIAAFEPERAALAAAPTSARGDEMQSIYVVVQGPDNSPALLDVRVTQFLTTLNTTLEALSATEESDGGAAASIWQNVISAQVIAKRSKPLSLSSATGSIWGEIAGRTFRFDRKQEELDVLANGHLEVSDVVSLFNSRVLEDGTSAAGRVAVQLYGADVEFTTPAKAWQADAQKQPTIAGVLPKASATATNVTDADPINKRLA